MSVTKDNSRQGKQALKDRSKAKDGFEKRGAELKTLHRQALDSFPTRSVLV